ncbi:transposase [Nonomuraea sp. NPDC051941]|uniref:transposase n=1 Tax=Nonomuraea sp. NPDC051941 TaxID=3364373 RepID=UPI0037CC9162
MSRKEKGSKNRAKARVKVARRHAKVTDARREFHHWLSTVLIRENQAIYVEDLAVKGLARTGTGQERARRGLGIVHRHGGVQGEAVRSDVREDRQVLSLLQVLFGLRGAGRTDAAGRTGVDLPVWGHP